MGELDIFAKIKEQEGKYQTAFDAVANVDKLHSNFVEYLQEEQTYYHEAINGYKQAINEILAEDSNADVSALDEAIADFEEGKQAVQAQIDEVNKQEVKDWFKGRVHYHIESALTRDEIEVIAKALPYAEKALIAGEDACQEFIDYMTNKFSNPDKSNLN